MATVTQFPTTNVVRSTPWTAPTDAYTDNNIGATGDGIIGNLVSNAWGTFGFDSAIPGGSAITNVTVNIKWQDGTFSGIGLNFGAVISGVDQTPHGVGTADEFAYRVDSTDITSDRTWTRADLLDGTFQVHLTIANDGAGTWHADVDYVSVTVTYTSGVPSLKHGPATIVRQSVNRAGTY